jgi:hypothetical protein
MVNNTMSRNKDQKSLESIYESIRIVKENEDDFAGGASFEGEGRDMGNIEGVTPEINDEPMDDVQDGENEDEEFGVEGISEDELAKLLSGIDQKNAEGEEVPQDVQHDLEEDEF